MASVRLDLGTPEHGWLPLTLSIGGGVIECRASYVADTLADLAYCALDLLEGRPARAVIFFEEPDATRVGFDELPGDMISVTVTRHRDLLQASNASRGTPVMASTASREEIARAIWSGMRRLEGGIGIAGIEAGWQRPYPAKEVAQLGERLEK